MKIVVTAPTSAIGSQFIKSFLRQKMHTLVLIHQTNQELVKEHNQGAKICHGDIFDPALYLEATKGADVVFYIAPHNQTSFNPIHLHSHFAHVMAQAITANKVKRVIHLSTVGAAENTGTGNALGFHDAELILNQTDAKTTHLRAAYLFDHFKDCIPSIEEFNNLSLPIQGNVKIPMVSSGDVAYLAEQIVLKETFTQQPVRYALGPKEVSFSEVAEEIGKALGKTIHFITLEDQETFDGLVRGIYSEEAARSLLEYYQALDAGYIQPTQPRNVKNTTPTTLSQFIHEELLPLLNRQKRNFSGGFKP